MYRRKSDSQKIAPQKISLPTDTDLLLATYRGGSHLTSRACLKNAFCKMCITICGRFRLNEGGVAGYVNRMKAKYTVNWGVQIAGMIFQTRSNIHEQMLLLVEPSFGLLFFIILFLHHSSKYHSSKKSLNFLLLVGCRSFLNAFASI